MYNFFNYQPPRQNYNSYNQFQFQGKSYIETGMSYDEFSNVKKMFNQNNFDIYTKANSVANQMTNIMSSGHNNAMQGLINTASQWNIVNNILEGNINGMVIGYDTETLGDVARTGNDLLAKEYGAITEFGISTHVFENGKRKKFLTNNKEEIEQISFAFGTNAKQQKAINELIDKIEKEGFGNLTAIEFSTAERLSRYAGPLHSVFRKISNNELDFIESIGGDREAFKGALVINKLAPSNPFSLYAIKSGAKNLQWKNNFSLDGANGNSIFASLMNLVANYQASDSIGVITANGSFDVNAINAQADLFGIKATRLNTNLQADVQDATRAIAYSRGKGIFEHQLDIANETGVIIKNNIRSFGGIGMTVEAMGIGGRLDRDAHNAGSDSLDVVHIVEAEYMQHKRMGELAEESLKKYVTNGTSEEFEVFSNDTVFFMKRNAYIDQNGFDVGYSNGELTNTSHSLGRYFKVSDAKQVKYYDSSNIDINGNPIQNAESKTGIAVNFVDASNDSKGFIKLFDNEESFRSFLENNTIVRHLSNKEDAYSVTQSMVNTQSKIAEADWARREYDRFTDISSVKMSSKGENIGGYANMKRYFDAYDTITNAITESGDSFNITRASNHEYDELIRKLDVFSSDYEITVFDAMAGRLHDEREVFNVVEEVVNNSGESWNNFKNTMIADNVMSALDNILDDEEHIDNVLYGYNRKTAIDIANSTERSILDLYSIDIKTPNGISKITADNITEMSRQIKSRLSGNTNAETINNMLESAKDLVSRGILSSNTYDFIERNVGNKNATQIYAIAENIATSINDSLFSVMEDAKMSQESYRTLLRLVANEDLDQFDPKSVGYDLTNEQLKIILNKELPESMPIHTRMYEMRANRIQINNEVKTVGQFINEGSIGGKSIRTILLESGEEQSKLLSQLNFTNGGSVSVKSLIAELGYTSEAKQEALANMFGGDTDYGLANDNWRNKITYTFATTDDNNIFLLLTAKKDSGKLAEGLVNKKYDMTNSKTLIQSIKEDAAVIELKRFNEHNLPYGGTMITASQGTKGFQKIMENKLDLWANGGIENVTSLSDIRGGIKNASDAMVESYRLRANTVILPSVARGEYENATRMSRKAMDSIFSDASGISGIQTLHGERISLMNLGDLMNGYNLELSELKKIIVPMASLNTGTGNPMDVLLNEFNAVSGIVNLKAGESLSSIEERMMIVNSPQFDEFFIEHLFATPIGSDRMLSVRMEKGMPLNQFSEKTIFDLIYDNRGQFSDSVRDSLDYINKNKENIYEVLKENQVEEFIVSLVNKQYAGQYSFLESHARPTALQQFSGRWFDAQNLKDTTRQTLRANNVRIGAPMLPKFEKELIDSYGGWDGLEHYTTMNIRQMSDLEIRQAYDRVTDDELKKLANENGLDYNKLRQTYNIMKNEMSTTYESKAQGRPSVFNTEIYTEPDMVTFKNANVLNLSEDSRKEVIERLRQNDWNIEKDFVFGEIETETGRGTIRKVQVTYNGPTGKITEEELMNLLNNGEGKILPRARAVSDIKAMAGTEKFTVHTLWYETASGELSLIQRVIQSNNKEEIDAYTDVIFDAVFNTFMDKDGNLFKANDSDKVSLIVNFESTKHLTGGFVGGGKLNTIIEVYESLGKQNEFISMMNANGFADWGFELLNNGTITYDISKMGKGGQMLSIYNLVNGIELDAVGDKDINKILRQRFRVQEQMNSTRYTLQKTINNEIMGELRKVDPRIRQQEYLNFMDEVHDGQNVIEGYTGMMDNGELKSYAQIIEEEQLRQMTTIAFDKEGLANKNQVFGSIKKAKLVKEEQEDVLRTISGMRQSLEYMTNLDDEFVEKSSTILSTTFEDILTSKSGITVEELKDTIFGTQGNPSDFIKNLAKTDGHGIDARNVSALSIDLGTDIVVNGKKTNKVVVPLQSVRPFEGDAYYIGSQTSVVAFLNRVKDLKDGIKGKTTEELLDRVNESANKMYFDIADDLSENKSSFIMKVLKREVPYSGQLLGQDATSPILKEMLTEEFLNAENKQELVQKMADRIRAGEVLDLATDYDYTGVAKVFKNGTLKTKNVYENVVYVSSEVLERFGVDFNRTGRQIYEDINENGEIYSYLGDKVLSYDSIDEINEKIYVDYAYKTGRFLDKDNIIDSLENERKYVKEFYNESINELKTYYKDMIDFTSGEDESKRLMKELNERTKQLINERNEKYENINSVFNFLGRDYYEKVGVMGKAVRYPVFNVGSDIYVRIRLDKNLHGQLGRFASWTAQMQKLDFDADTEHLNLYLDRFGGLLRNTEKLQIAAYGNFQRGNLLNSTVIANLIEEGAGTKADSLTDIYKFMEASFKVFDGERYDEIVEQFADFGSDAEAEARKSKIMIDAVTSFNTEHGNTLMNEMDIITSIKARINKGNIGYYSSPSYTIRNVMLDLEDSMDKNIWGNILHDLSTNQGIKGLDGLLWLTEQKGIDVKHSRNLSIAETPRWSAGVTKLFSQYGNRKENVDVGLEHILASSEKILFAGDSSYNRALYKKEILSTERNALMDIAEREYNKLINSGNSVTEAYDKTSHLYRKAWIRSLVDLSNDEKARALYSSKIVKRTSNYKGLMQKVNELLGDYSKLDKITQELIDSTAKSKSSMRHILDVVNSIVEDERVKVKVGEELLISSATVSNKMYGYTLRSVSFDEQTKEYYAMFNKLNLDDELTPVITKKGNVGFKTLHASTLKGINELIDKEFLPETTFVGEYRRFKTGVDGSRNTVQKRAINASQESILNDLMMKMKGRSDNDWKRNVFGVPFIDKNGRKTIKSGTFLGNLNSVKSLQDVSGTNRLLYYTYAQAGSLNDLFAGISSEDMADALIDFKNKIEYINNISRTGFEFEDVVKRINAGIKEKSSGRNYKQILEDSLVSFVGGSNELDKILDGMKNIPSGFDFESYNKAIKNISTLTANLTANEDFLLREFQSLGIDITADNIKTKINNVMAILEQENDAIIFKNQKKIYDMFSSQDEIMKFFRLGTNPTGDTLVSFGQFMGRSFSSLKGNDIRRILSQNLDDQRLSDKEKFTMAWTQNLLQRWQTSQNIVNENYSKIGIMKTKLVDDTLESARETYKKTKTTEKVVKDVQETMKEKTSKMTKKTVSDENIAKKIFSKNHVGLQILGAAAIIGIANNIVHKHAGSPLVPDQKEKENTNQQYPEVNHNLAPATKRSKTIYVDPNTGVNFKVSAKTTKYLSEKDTAKMFLQSGMGQSLQINSQDDMSKVSENWLERRFSELL